MIAIIHKQISWS